MISLKRNYEIVLIDENNRDEKFELVDVLSLKDNTLCGMFEATNSFSDVFYNDDYQEEVNFAVKTKVQLKSTIDLDSLSVNDFTFLTKEQEYCFQLFTKNLMMDAREGKFNFYKENSKFANVDKHKPDLETVKFDLVTNSMYDYDEYYEIFKNVFTSYNRRTVEIVIKKYNSK